MLMKSRPTLVLKPAPNRDDGAIEILQITDIHLLPNQNQTLLGVNTENSARQVFDLAKVNHWPPDLIVLTGDLTQEPLAAPYRRLDRWLRNLNVPCFCLPGNHDDPRVMSNAFRSSNVYCSSRILGDAWQIICLNTRMPESEGGHLSEESLRMLEIDLDLNPEKFATIFLHHHPLPIGSAWMDTMVLDNKERFFQILESRPQVRAVVCGHIHQVFDAQVGNIRVLGTPSTCFQFKPESENFMLDDLAPGYRRIALFPDGSLETEVVRLKEIPDGLHFRSEGYLK